MSGQKTAGKRKVSRQTAVLLILSIIMTCACLVGAVWQYVQYGSIMAGHHHQTELNGASGYRSNYDRIITALTTYNGSQQAAADEAMNIAVFLTIGSAAGAFLMYHAIRQYRREQQAPEPEEEQHPMQYTQPRRRHKPPLITH